MSPSLATGSNPAVTRAIGDRPGPPSRTRPRHFRWIQFRREYFCLVDPGTWPGTPAACYRPGASSAGMITDSDPALRSRHAVPRRPLAPWPADAKRPAGRPDLSATGDRDRPAVGIQETSDHAVCGGHCQNRKSGLLDRPVSLEDCRRAAVAPGPAGNGPGLDANNCRGRPQRLARGSPADCCFCRHCRSLSLSALPATHSAEALKRVADNQPIFLLFV